MNDEDLPPQLRDPRPRREPVEQIQLEVPLPLEPPPPPPEAPNDDPGVPYRGGE